MATKNQALAQISNLAQATARNSISPTDLALVFSTMLDACYSELDDSDEIEETDNRLDALANVGNRGAAIALSDADVKPQAASLPSAPALVVYLRKSDCVAGLSGGEYYLNWPGREAFSQSSGKPYSNGLYRIDGKLHIYLSGSMVSVTSLLAEASTAAPGLMTSADKLALVSLMRNVVVIEGFCESTADSHAQAATVGGIWWETGGDHKSPRLKRRTAAGWEVPTEITEADGSVPTSRLFISDGQLFGARKFKDTLQPDYINTSTDDYFACRDTLFHESPDITAEVDADMVYTLLLTDRAKRAAFEEYVGRMGVTKDAATGLYALNGVTDITWEQLLDIMAAGRRTTNSIYGGYASLPIRTHLPRVGDTLAADGYRAFAACRQMEAIEWPSLRCTGSTFAECRMLRRINVTVAAVFDLTAGVNNFTNCVALEEVRGCIRGNNPLSFADSPKLSLASLEYMVDHAYNTAVVTVTLHPETFGRLTSELVAAAGEKKISFVSS